MNLRHADTGRDPAARSLRSLAARAGLALALSILAGCGGGSEPVEQAAAPAISPIEVEDRLAAAEQRFETGEVQDAWLIVRSLIEDAPDDARVHEMAGRVLFARAGERRKVGEHDAADDLVARAAAAYDQAVRLDPDSAGLWHSAGMMRYEAGRSSDALDAFQRSQALDPARPKGAVFAAQVLIEQQRWDEAERTLDGALELEPDLPHALASLAVVHWRTGRIDSAVELVARARDHAPGDVGICLHQARILRADGQHRRALEKLLYLPAEERASLPVAEAIARGFHDLDRPLDAADAWMAAFRAANADEATRRVAWRAAAGAAEALLEAGERDRAAIWFRQARAAAPDAPEVLALERAFAGTGG